MGLAKDKAVSLLAVAGFAPCVYAALQIESRRIGYNLIISSLLSLAGFLLTRRVIPILKPAMLRANLFGMDINKRGT